jgi:hypothetical protein
MLGRYEPREGFGRKRDRQRFDTLLQSPLASPAGSMRLTSPTSRFDTLLQSPLASLEPHLRWALSVVADAVTARRVSGPDWAQLLDDVSSWDRGEEHRGGRDVREKWACQYLEAAKVKGETGHAR